VSYTSTMLIAHISDFHIVEPGHVFSGRVDTARGLRDAIDAINHHIPRPDLVIATGDLVNDATPGQYDQLREILNDLIPPVLFVPGNHDERRACEQLPSRPMDLLDGSRHGSTTRATAHVNPVVDVLRSFPGEHTAVIAEFADLIIIALDTTIPGRHDGLLGQRQLDWLDAALSEFADRNVLIAQHHPPFSTGIEQMDQMGLVDADDEAAVLERHHNVVGVLCGHLHRFIASPIGNTVAVCAPSTGAQLSLNIGGAHPAYTDERPAMLLHLLQPGHRLVTHVQPIPVPEAWLPEWAT
jgi:Icc protein